MLCRLAIQCRAGHHVLNFCKVPLISSSFAHCYSAQPRTRHRQAHPANLRGSPASGKRLAIPGAASSGGERLDRRLLGSFRNGQTRPLLSAHAGGPQTSGRRTIEMGGAFTRHRAGFEPRGTGGAMKSFFRKLTWLARRPIREADLKEELQFHLEEAAESQLARGRSASDARLAARRDLGNLTRVQEEARAAWSWTLVEHLGQDIRYGLRTMAANKAFS